MEDTEVIRKEFAQLLRELTSSKDSIQKATKMMVEHTDHSEELFGTLMKRLKKTVAKRRLPLFYLLDSVCQVSKAKSQKEYRELVAKHLNDIVGLIVPDEGDSRDKAYPVVAKVLGLWKERKVFSGDCIKRAKRRIEGDRGNTKERHIVCVGMDIDGVQKQMEEDRRENKRSRWECSLRPANDPPDAEFNEMWDRFTKEEDFKKAYPELSYKNPHIRDPIRGRPPKGLSASTPSMSSTSPSTPSSSRYSLSSPRDVPSSSSSPALPSPPSPLSAQTPVYITPSETSNPNTPQPPTPNNPPPEYLYYRNDNRAYPDYPPERFARGEWGPPREGLPPQPPPPELIDGREIDPREREMYEREMRERELRGEMPPHGMPPPPPPMHNNYEPGYPPHPVNIPPQYMPPMQPPMRYEYDREPMPPRYDYPDPHYREREYRDNLRGSGGRDMRDMRDFRDIRDLRDLRDVRELRDSIGYREGGNYPHPPPPGPPLSPRNYNNGPPHPLPPIGMGWHGMDNPNVPYNTTYRNGNGGGFYTPSGTPSPPRSPYSPTSSMYVHHQPPPSRQTYDHRPPSARQHRYPPRV